MYGLEHCSTVVRDLIELRQAATPDGDKLLSFLVAKKEDLDYLSEALDSSLKTGIMEVSTEVRICTTPPAANLTMSRSNNIGTSRRPV